MKYPAKGPNFYAIVFYIPESIRKKVIRFFIMKNFEI